MKDIHNLLFLFSKKCFFKFVLLFFYIFIPLASAQVINDVNKAEILKEAEFIYKEGKWEEAYAKILPIIPLTHNELTQYPVALKLQSSLVENGNKLLISFDYINSIANFEKALNINPENEIKIQKDAILTEFHSPKVIVEGEVISIAADPADKKLIKNNYLAFRTVKDKVTFYQGDPLRIKFLWSEKLQNLNFKLLNFSNQKISDAEAFELTSTKVNNIIWYGFLATYVNQKAETLKLLVEATKKNKEKITWISTVELIPKTFPECTINLNEQLTSLVTKPDPKKDEEAKFLRELMSTFNTASQYETDNFILPVENAKITTQFGERTIFAYNTGKKNISIHKGIDYAKPIGTPVKAMGNGKVVLARNRIISGLSIVIEHMPGIFTSYFHLSKIFIKEGDLVNTSQQIGEIGNTGLSTGAHLHLGMEIHGIPVNPDFFIKNKFIFE